MGLFYHTGHRNIFAWSFYPVPIQYPTPAKIEERLAGLLLCQFDTTRCHLHAFFPHFKLVNSCHCPESVCCNSCGCSQLIQPCPSSDQYRRSSSLFIAPRPVSIHLHIYTSIFCSFFSLSASTSPSFFASGAATALLEAVVDSVLLCFLAKSCSSTASAFTCVCSCCTASFVSFTLSTLSSATSALMAFARSASRISCTDRSAHIS